LKGKNQRNFNKSTIAKRQKGTKKNAERKNERAHFFRSAFFLGFGTGGASAKAEICFGAAFCLASFSYHIYKVFCRAFFQKSDRLSPSNCNLEVKFLCSQILCI